MKIKNIYKDARKVLVFNPSFIGDAILTTPLVTAVQRLLPDAEVTLCVRPESAPLFKELDFNVMIFDKRSIDSGIGGARRFIHKLKSEKFDIVLSPHKSVRTSLILKMSGIPVRIGFTEAAFNWVYTYTLSRNMSLHEAERNLSLLSAITDEYTLESAKDMGGGLRTFLDAEFADIAGDYMRTVADGKKIVGINAGSVWNTKRWPVEYYAKLVSLLHSAGYVVAVIGGPQDNKVSDQLMAEITANGIEFFDFADKLRFENIPALISTMTLLITNDSAPMHIAVSQNTPVIGIFGPTVPAFGFAPYGGKNVICEMPDLACRPCGLHGGERCPKKHFKCMRDLRPEYVFETAQKI